MRRTSLLAFLLHASLSLASYSCGSGVVYTSGSPCTFCPTPTCTNLEVATKPCQSFGPCNTLSCAGIWATWTQPCPTTLTTTLPVPRGGCRTFIDTVTNSPATGCLPLTCSTPYCLALTAETADCGCAEDVYSTTTVGCPTNWNHVPCPSSTYSFVYTNY